MIIKEKLRGNDSIMTESRLCSLTDFSKFELSCEVNWDLGTSVNFEDKLTGLAIYFAITHCPTMDIKLFNFANRMISNESSITVIQTYVNLFRSKVVKDKKSNSLLMEFYHVLAKTLDLQYGNILLAKSTKSQLQAVIDNDWPFFTNNTDLVKDCLSDSDCDGLQNIIQEQGINLYVHQSWLTFVSLGLHSHS